MSLFPSMPAELSSHTAQAVALRAHLFLTWQQALQADAGWAVTLSHGGAYSHALFEQDMTARTEPVPDALRPLLDDWFMLEPEQQFTFVLDAVSHLAHDAPLWAAVFGDQAIMAAFLLGQLPPDRGLILPAGFTMPSLPTVQNLPDVEVTGDGPPPVAILPSEGTPSSVYLNDLPALIRFDEAARGPSRVEDSWNHMEPEPPRLRGRVTPAQLAQAIAAADGVLVVEGVEVVAPADPHPAAPVPMSRPLVLDGFKVGGPENRRQRRARRSIHARETAAHRDPVAERKARRAARAARKRNRGA